MFRTVCVTVFLTVFTLLAGPPLILHAWLTGSVELMYRAGVGAVMFAVRMAGVRVRVEGRENIPPGACIFAANHTSSADAPAIVGAIPRRIAILAKASLFRIPIVSWAFRLALFVPVDRADRDAAIASLDIAVERLQQGVSFLIYPEGTRSPDGRLLPFKKGLAMMAIKAGVPVVAMACAGAHRVMPKNDLAIYPGEIVVRFQPAIDAATYTLEQRDALTARVHAAIAAGLPPDQQPLV